MPEEFVDTVTEVPPPAKVPLAPLAGAVNVTLAPLTGFPPESLTVATNGAANAAFTCPLWPPPLVAVIDAGGPTVFVTVKVAEKLATKADTVYVPPAVPLAVKVGDVAVPEASDNTVTTLVPPAKVPLGPLLGAKNVTVADITGLLLASRTTATNGAANGVLVRALWPPPLAAEMDATPGVIVAFVLAEVKPGADALITAGPMVMPVNCAGVAGVVAPAGMKTAGVTVAFEGSLLTSVIVTPPAGAPKGKLRANGTDWPAGADTPGGRLMPPKSTTVTVAVISGKVGSALACITAGPGATPLTGRGTVVALGANTTVLGTVATVVSLEVVLTVSPLAGAGADRFNVRFWVAFLARVRAGEAKLSPAPTVTVALAPVKPEAEALMVAVPKLTPVTLGCVAGVVVPCEMKTSAGDIVALDVSLLERWTVTPPSGAPVTKEMGKVADWFGPTVMPAGSVIAPNSPTFTFAEPLKYPAELATIVVEPSANPVTVKAPALALFVTKWAATDAGKLALELPAGMVTLGGSTSTIPAGFERNATVAPPAGAGELSVTEPFMVRPTPTVEESRVIAMLRGATFTVTAPEEIPVADATIVVVPVVLPPVTVTVVVDVLAGTVTLEGTDAMLGSKLAMFTVSPLGPAAFGIVRVSVLVELRPTFNGLGVSVMAVLAAPVIITVTGGLFTNLSLTINCAT
jgi:hypothetical protein